MRLLPSSTGPGRMLRHSRFTRARLKSNPKAKMLVAYIDPQHAVLKAAQLACNDADDIVMDARAAVTEVDTAVDDLLVAFQLDVMKLVSKNYADPLYGALFPKGFGEVRRLRGAQLAGEVLRIEQTISAQGKSSALSAYISKFQQCQKDWQAPLTGLKAAVAAQTQAGNALDKAKHDWGLAYDAVYGHLRALFPGKKAFVDSFFLPAEAGKKAKANGQLVEMTA